MIRGKKKLEHSIEGHKRRHEIMCPKRKAYVVSVPSCSSLFSSNLNYVICLSTYLNVNVTETFKYTKTIEENMTMNPMYSLCS